MSYQYRHNNYSEQSTDAVELSTLELKELGRLHMQEHLQKIYQYCNQYLTVLVHLIFNILFTKDYNNER